MSFAGNIGSMLGGLGVTGGTPPPSQQQLSAVTGTGLWSNGSRVSPLQNTAIDVDVYRKLEQLKGYVELCGDKLEYVHMDKMMETVDSKISVLKLANAGDFIKNVGLRYNEDTYYIIREKE
jgi:hypothetical protein